MPNVVFGEAAATTIISIRFTKKLWKTQFIEQTQILTPWNELLPPRSELFPPGNELFPLGSKLLPPGSELLSYEIKPLRRRAKKAQKVFLFDENC